MGKPPDVVGLCADSAAQRSNSSNRYAYPERKRLSAQIVLFFSILPGSRQKPLGFRRRDRQNLSSEDSHKAFSDSAGFRQPDTAYRQTKPFSRSPNPVARNYNSQPNGFAERLGNPPENAENPRRRQGFRVACGFSKLRRNRGRFAGTSQFNSIAKNIPLSTLYNQSTAD